VSCNNGIERGSVGGYPRGGGTLKRYDLLVGFALGVATLLIIFILSSDFAAHCEVCETTKEGAKECARYGVVHFALHEISAAVDSSNGFITAIATAFIAWFTLSLRQSTDKLWDAGNEQRLSAEAIAKRQSGEMQKSIAVANRAAEVAEKALIAADRAWISIDAKIIGSLTFDEDVVSLNVEFKMTNVGKSPATHVELFAMLCPDIIAARDTGEATIEMLHTKIFDFGVVLFPKGVNPRELIIGMPIAQFRENIADSAKVVTEHGSAADVQRKTANPAIMACASYCLPGSKRRHHTVILFQVWHTDDRHPGWDGSADETDLILLRLVQTFMSGQVT
jgi:hypothetical protein